MVLGKTGCRAVLVTVCALISEAAFSGEAEDVVIDEIVATHERIRNEFRPTKVISSFEEIEAPGKDKVTRGFEFLFRNDNVLVITELVVTAANDEYAFRIRQATADSAWSIVDVEAASDSGASTTIGTVIALNQDPLGQVLKANHIPIVEFLTSSNTRIASLSEMKKDGERHVQIEVQVLNPRAQLDSGLEFRFAKGTLMFRPNSLGWIPEKIEMIGPENDGLTFINSGFVPMGGFLIPTKLRLIGRLTNGRQWECANSHVEFGFDEIPQERFFLSYYGLPEPTIGLTPSSMRLWWFLAGATLLVLVFALVLYRRFSG